MGRIRISILAFGLLLTSACSAPGAVRSAEADSLELRGPGGVIEDEGGERPLSPRVLASWIIRQTSQRPGGLLLLVLWRGEPGWYENLPHWMFGCSVASHDVISAAGAIEEQWLKLRCNPGNERQDLMTFYPMTRTLEFQGRTLALGEDNVVFVDRVRIEGTRLQGEIVGTARVDVPPSTRSPEMETVLRTIPTLQEFVR